MVVFVYREGRREIRNREADLKPLSDCFADEFYRMCSVPARRAAFQILRDPGMAEDVAQEALWRVWASGGKYDPSRGILLHGSLPSRAISRSTTFDRQ